MREFLPELAGNRELKETISAAVLRDPPGLSHAYIIEGRPGSGRRTLALGIASALVCRKRGDPGSPLPCGVCPVCRRIAAGIHPDVQTVGTDEGRQSVGVEAVRTLREDIFIRPVELDYRIVILNPADRMTAQAQNALLLTLEEPPSYAIFFLICEDSRDLLETVVSRSQTLRTAPLGRDELEQTLLSRFPEARDAKQSRKERFESALDASDGYVGAALEALAGDEKDWGASGTAAKFISLAADAAHPSRAALCLYKGAGNSRDAATGILREIISLAEELLAARTGNAPPPEEDSPEAKLGTGRLARILTAASGAVAELQQNRNVRLTLLCFIEKIIN
ncbi:MAG: hypothetical protein J6V01_06195 [Clostridia bacterium]|nr:hypothetical protein [Clostridia bacterium]